MITVTTKQLADAFVAKILAITPTYESFRSTRWSYVPVGRKGGRALLQGQAMRSFDLIWGAAVPSYEWFGTGEAYVVKLSIAVSYAATDPEHLDHIKTADAVDLRRALNQLRDPTLPGLTDVRAVGLANESADEANVYAEHTFDVHYHQDTNALV